MVNWRRAGKIGLIAASTTVVGVPVVQYAVDSVQNYRAALARIQSAELLPYVVPQGQLVDVEDFANAEGLMGHDRTAYCSDARETMLPGWNRGSDGSMWHPNVEQWFPDRGVLHKGSAIIDEYEWEHAGMPFDLNIKLRDVDGNGYVGGTRGLRLYEELLRAEMKAKTSGGRSGGNGRKMNGNGHRGQQAQVAPNVKRLQHQNVMGKR
jgi:hypothetical protein